MVMLKSAALIFMLFSLLAGSPLRGEELSRYWSVDHYLAAHPEQAALLDAFALRVADSPQPLPSATGMAPVRVAIVSPDIQASDYWHRSLKAFSGRAKALGLNLQITVYSARPGAIDPVAQVERLREALDSQPDYLVYTLDTPVHHRLAERLLAISSTHQAGPKIILQNITTPLRAWDGMQPWLYVGFDHVEGSRMLARHFIEHTQGRGEVVMLYAGEGYISQSRGDTFLYEIAKFPDLALRATYLTQLQMEKARRATEDALIRYPDLTLIYACATDIALGAAAAVTAASRESTLLINGWGGGGQELQLLQQGVLAATVMRMNDDAGVAMAEAIAMDQKGQGHQVPRLFAGEMVLLTRDMTPDTIRALEQRAFRYSGLPDPITLE
ncbi:autoinducer 2-binding protein LuxP [Ectothiorhodospira magna]|uniref:Autoinducer 2-binding protein LuxP n=2 Tax=Ectothiorhodospira magna TaxID=867345 RepID=A0A1H9E9A4_9GAMM|nr:autoinducer 2-binding protein LuxP [Ectothiorhodospira magna]